MSSASNAKTPEVPLFLRKTYHMIDTCDSNVACWSEDGQTFIIKNTPTFEKSVIPQFFKHSKFSSFVRQLNFYGFRKIKYADTIRIDPKLEAETAKFWRFRHDKFVRGKPELLSQIKRANSNSSGTAAKKVPATVVSEDTGSLKSEVSVLKKRIEAMTKNIDDLTELVQKASLKTEEEREIENCGNKRKKVDMVPDTPLSSAPAPSAMDVDPLLDLPPLPVSSMSNIQRESSTDTDEDFVSDLFTAFGDDAHVEGLLNDTYEAPKLDEDEVDPVLMRRLGDALKLLPREMQEMIVDRLVGAIMNSDALQKGMEAVSDESKVKISRVPVQSGKALPSQTTSVVEKPATPPQVPVTLAAATLSALLAQYSDVPKNGKQSIKPLTNFVPVHA